MARGRGRDRAPDHGIGTGRRGHAGSRPVAPGLRQRDAQAHRDPVRPRATRSGRLPFRRLRRPEEARGDRASGLIGGTARAESGPGRRRLRRRGRSPAGTTGRLGRWEGEEAACGPSNRCRTQRRGDDGPRALASGIPSHPRARPAQERPGRAAGAARARLEVPKPLLLGGGLAEWPTAPISRDVPDDEAVPGR